MQSTHYRTIKKRSSFYDFNYQNVFYDYDLEKMALASGFTAIEQRKEVAEIFEGKLSQNTLLTMQEKIDQAKQATVGQDENSAFSAVHVYRDQAAILEYLTNSDDCCYRLFIFF